MTWRQWETQRNQLKQLVVSTHAIAAEVAAESFAIATEIRKVADRLDELAERLRTVRS